MTILVSVVVPTYRRPLLLERCLQALFTQNFPADAYEVIVVDDAPETDATRALIAEWQQRLSESVSYQNLPSFKTHLETIPVTGRLAQDVIGKYIPVMQVASSTPRLQYITATQTRGPAAARNIGWRAAAGQIIAFTDDDCIPEPDWLFNGIAAFVEGVAGVSGRILVPLPPDPTDNDRNTTGLERSDFVTANCFYRRAVLQEVGGFDERFKDAWREDSDLFFTVRKRNFPLAWASEAIVLHPVREEKWGASLRQQRKTFYNALLYKKHPDLYWRYIQPVPPWHYYGMLAGMLVGIAGLLFGQRPVTAVGLAFWVGLVGRFIFKRLEHTSKRPDHVIEMIVTSLVIPFLAVYWRLRGSLHWRVFFL